VSWAFQSLNYRQLRTICEHVDSPRPPNVRWQIYRTFCIHSRSWWEPAYCRLQQLSMNLSHCNSIAWGVLLSPVWSLCVCACEWLNGTHDGNVNVILTLICNTNTTLSTDCRPRVTITAPGGTPYEASDVLTCNADGSSPTYAWSGTNGGSSFSSTSSTVSLEAGEFCLICTATLNSDEDCSARASRCDSAYSKYRKQCYNLVESTATDLQLFMTTSGFY